MWFKKNLQYPGARRTRAWHQHGSDKPTSPRAILLHKDQIFYSFLHKTVTLLHYFPESEGECVNDYVTEIIPDYNVIESGNCGMKFECADGTCIDAEGKNFLPIFIFLIIRTNYLDFLTFPACF